MILERIESKGIAHYSYIFGDRNRAAVIDPRRDCEIYIKKASEENLQITHIFETHRNEDYAIGSVELGKRTDSEIWHADEQLEYKYGQSVKDGQEWQFGRLTLKAIHTPGHTPGSMSYLLDDPNGNPWIIFTGDALFAGDVGRVDLLGLDKMKDLAEMLHETIFNKILPLGDHIIVCPGHGAGSVCGADIAERIWTTVGLEKKHNKKLKCKNKEDFISKISKKLDRPHYFRKMEKYNIEGAPILGSLPILRPLSATEFANIAKDSIIIDSRMEISYGAAHILNSISIWLEGIPAFAGWFLNYDRPILIVSEPKDIEQITRYLIRLGYDKIAGYLSGGILSWHTAGFESSSIKMMTVQELCTHLDEYKDGMILDVRSKEELEKVGKITNAKHIHLTQLLERLNEIPKDQTTYLFCGSGLRSMTAASILKRNRWNNLVVVLGGIAGWNSMTCPIK
jgi:hydroxyacylglutathione hydrolase